MSAVAGAAYRHFKGDLYIVQGFAMDVEQDPPVKLVLYHPVGKIPFDGIPCSRTEANFLEEVDRPDFTYKGPRFRRVPHRKEG